FAGTGLKNGDAIRGLLGYEVDAIYGGGPRGIVRLSHSPFPDQAAQGRIRYADMTLYTAASGALVFAAGSIQWSWGLDVYNAPTWHTARTSEAAQKVTRNVLDRMLQTAAGGRPSERPWLPSPIVLVASVVAIAFVLRTWISRRMVAR